MLLNSVRHKCYAFHQRLWLGDSIRNSTAIATATTLLWTRRSSHNHSTNNANKDGSSFLLSSPSDNNNNSNEKKGEYYYHQAKRFIEEHNISLAMKEEENRKQQYEKTKSGLAVIKTIARQTRQERENQQNQKTDVAVTRTKSMDNAKNGNLGNNVIVDHLEKARECMQIAAFVHGYNDAIVSIANDALSKAQINAECEYKYVMEQETVIDMDDINSNGTKSGAHVAIKLYLFAGERGSKEAWFNLGHLLWTGHDLNSTCNILPNHQKAIEAFQKAVELGDDDARYFLAVCYLGQEMQHDKRRGLRLVQEAADHGHGGALYYLALLYRNGHEELCIDPCLTLFREYLDEAADNNDPDALFMRAHCMFHGEDGYDMDKVKSLEGFLEAGKAGNADGYVSAGAIYHHGGINVKQDPRKAFELYQLAGEMGSAEGWKNVIACYFLGEGVPKCEKTAQYIQKTILGSGMKEK